MYQNQYQQGGYGQPQGNANYGTNGSYGANGQNAGTNGTGNVYVGSAKFQQGQYGLMVSISLNAEDIAKLQANLNANGWVTFSLRERQQPSQSGATHYGVIRPPMDNQGGYGQPQGNANWNGQVGPVGPVGQRGNQWNGARGQGYQQGQYPQNYRQAPPQGANYGANRTYGANGQNAQRNGQGQYPQGYDNGGFNQGPAGFPPQGQGPIKVDGYTGKITDPRYAQTGAANPLPPPNSAAMGAPAPQPAQHRYTPADAQPPAAEEDDLINNDMPM